MSEAKKSRLKSAALVLFLFLVFTSAVGYAVFGTNAFNRSSTTTYLECNGLENGCTLHVPLKVNLALNLTVTDKNGKVISNEYLPHDLILNNFYNFLIAFLLNPQSSQTVSASLKDTSSSSTTLNVWGGGNGAVCGSNGAIDWSCANFGQGGLIEVGTSTTAAARTDSNLGNPFQSFFFTSSTCSAGSTDSVVVTGSENANSGATVTEAGLFVQDTGFNGAVHTFILAHDVFSGVAVSGGNTLTVQYTWSLNSGGFNYNLCEVMAAYFTQPNGAGNQVKTPNSLMVFFDTSGRNVSWAPYCYVQGFQSASGALAALGSSSPGTSQCAAWANGDTTNILQVAVGTGSSSFTPTSRSLSVFYAQNFISSTTYDSAGNAYETANILLGTGATISEAAIYLTLPKGCIGFSPNHSGSGGACITSYASDTIMWLAATFTGVSVPNGQSIGITFQESG